MCELSLYCEINQEVNRRISVISDARRRRNLVIDNKVTDISVPTTVLVMQ